MIDGIKAILSDNLDAVRSNPLLDFELSGKVSAKTGEIKTGKYAIARYKGLTFIDRGSVIEVRGSIHVYNNNGIHNYNSFGLSEIHLVLFELADKLSVVSDNAELKNLEFGVNMAIDFAPGDFLNSIIGYKSKLFTHQREKNKDYRECALHQFFIKVYDKGLQHGLNKFILRFELKYIKMEKINSMGIRYLSDLLDPVKLQELRQMLLQVYDEILIGDNTVEPAGLLTKDEVLFAKGHNPNHWVANLPKPQRYEKGAKDKKYRADKTLYYRRVERFKELLSETGADAMKKHVRSLMHETSKNLLANAQQKCVKMTSCLGDTHKPKMCQNDQVEITDEMCQNDPLFYSVNNTSLSKTSVRCCLVTGLDISMQKDTSKYLCTEGVKYYKENEPEVWEQLQNRLSPKWKDAPIDKKIAEIHHSIRNENLNKIHNTRRSINNVLTEPALFDQLQLICKDKLAIAGMLN